jgi:hypothetical protein
MPPPDPHPALSGSTDQKLINDRRLPNPHVPTDEDELACACGRVLEPPLQEMEFMLTPDNGTCRHRWQAIQGARQAKAIALPSHRLEIPRRRRRVA